LAVATWASEATQTVGIYPRALHDRLRDGLALSGVRHIRELTTSLEGYVYGDGRYTLMLPYDGMETDAPDGPLDDRPRLTEVLGPFRMKELLWISA